MFQEPTITINGQTCTNAETMTLRVALGTFYMQMNFEGLGTDDAGQKMADGYRNAIRRLYARMSEVDEDGN